MVALINIEQIGSYAGFAAVLGLAVLSALYFSQSRDLKRLRDWAGRAPERDAEARSRVAAATNLRQTPAAQAQQGQAAAAKPAAAAASGNNSAAAPVAAPAKAGVGAGAVGAASSAGAAGAAGAGAASRGGGVAAPARPARVSAQTSVLKPEDAPPQPWYRAPRYIALIIAGVLVVGGGVTVGALQLFKNSSPSPASSSSSGSAARGQNLAPQKNPAAPLRPGDINVAVLNATGVQGLAQTYGDKVQANGFVKGSVGNYTGPPRAESVVMYAPGKKAAARLVSRKFGVSAIAPEDGNARKVAPTADIVLVMGADKQGG
ncbi:MAG: hypothetical protein QOJ12_327 [Thermoleophilales bacterium]|nr:hypothetical protein [Thermoleophilales bacterium]